jgi:hypothetical protein
MPHHEDLLEAVRNLNEAVRGLSSQEIEELLQRRKSEDKALRSLWRAALWREKQQRREAREARLAREVVHGR